MGYQLFVEFGDRKSPTAEDVQKVLRGLDQNFAGMEGNLLRAIDAHTGDPLSIDIGQSGAIKLEVPFAATFRSVAAAYGLAWALADKFGGKVKDPQLGGTPSLDLARLEWRRHEATEGLAKIFGGSVPRDLSTKIRQRRGVLSQEVEIQGSDLEIQRRDRGRSVRYFVPILSLGPIQENSVPNPFGILMVIVGMAILFAAGFVGRPLGRRPLRGVSCGYPSKSSCILQTQEAGVSLSRQRRKFASGISFSIKERGSAVLEFNRPGEVCSIPLSTDEAYASIGDRY